MIVRGSMMSSETEMLCEFMVLHLNNHHDAVYFPLKRSERIKYTCFTFSKSYLIFGATSGGLYLFRRNPCNFWQLIPSKENAVSLVSISSTENFIAYATNKGIVCVIELTENQNNKLIMRSDDLSDSEITALCWCDDSGKPTLYIGDSCGRVSYLKLSFLNKNILHLPTTILMTLDSKVVQLCWQSDYLLVSTLSRCYLCDIIKEQFKQIGQQLRDGLYGTCFLKNSDGVRIFCARPGFRLWEVDLAAVVHTTHQFKQKLAKPPSPFISVYEEKIIDEEQTKSNYSPQSFNFIKLYDLLGRYIFTYKKDSIFILNIDTADILFWSNYFGDIIDAQCISNTIFLWTGTNGIHELVLLTVEQCLLTLFFRKQFKFCVDIIRAHLSKLMNSNCLAMLHPLCELECELNEEDSKMMILFKNKIRSTSAKSIELNNGIYLINNKHLSNCLLDDFRVLSLRQVRKHIKNEDLEFRKRSQSLPSKLQKTDKKYDCNLSQKVTNPISYSSNHYHNASSYVKEMQTNDSFYLEMGLYNSPFITLASYEILQESFAEIGASFTEKFSESSKNLKEKWRLLENKIKLLTSEKRERIVSIPKNNSSINVNYQDDDMFYKDEISEPVVDLKKQKTIESEMDYSKIMELCENISDDLIEKTTVFEFINSIIAEYYSTCKKFGLNIKLSYRNFHFNFIPEKIVVKLKELIVNIFFQKEFLLEWLKSENCCIKTEGLNFEELYPPLLTLLFPTSELNYDFKLCKMLIIFSELLNALTILEVIKSLDLPCYYLSFCYLMKYFQNGEILERNAVNKVKNNHWPLVVYLNAMLLMISLDQLDVFYEMGLKRNVDITYIAYMMLHLEHSELNNNKDSDSKTKFKFTFLTYLHKFCNIDANCLENISVLQLAFKMFIIVNEKFNSCCTSCWFLLPQQQIKIKFIELGRLLLSTLWNYFQEHSTKNSVSNSYTRMLTFRKLINERTDLESFEHFCYKNQDSCKHIICQKLRANFDNILLDNARLALLSFSIICCFCYRIPALWKHLPKLQKNSPFKVLHLQHFIQLEIIEEIESDFEQLSYDDARMILNFKSSLLSGNCLNCGCKIPINEDKSSWNDLILFILRRIGAKSTLKLLNEFKGSVILDKRFYRSLILTSIPGIESEFKERVIFAVSDHFNINPASSEVLEKLKDSLKRDKPDHEFNIKSSSTHHWGIMVNMENNNQTICYCCSLPLFAKSLIKEDNGGIMVFSCSHTYHTVCLKNKNCTATCLVCDRFLR